MVLCNIKDPHFIVHCAFTDCIYDIHRGEAFKRHVSRKHEQADSVLASNHVENHEVDDFGSDDDADM